MIRQEDLWAKEELEQKRYSPILRRVYLIAAFKDGSCRADQTAVSAPVSGTAISVIETHYTWKQLLDADYSFIKKENLGLQDDFSFA